MPIATSIPDAPCGLYEGISNDAYHAGPGVSKSGLWTIHKKTPRHFRYPAPKERKYFDFGEACHLAILQPDHFEKIVVRGPADRRGNKWSDLLEACGIDGKLLLTAGDYDATLAIRDTVHSDDYINAIVTGGNGIVEASNYWTDPETGELCKCRPDLYRPDIGVLLDVKTTQDAGDDAFARSVVDYGYHAQEAWYSDGIAATGLPVNGFLFLAFEKESPYAFSLNELPPSIVAEGRAIMRRSLETYARCRAADDWPGYGSTVRELKFPRWAYKVTEAPKEVTEEYA